MPKKHHAIYSDPTGAAASASPAKRRTARAKRTESPADGTSAPVAELGGVTQEPIVNRDAVARLAYSYWEARGFIGGSPEEDWLRAENEIRNNHAASAVA